MLENVEVIYCEVGEGGVVMCIMHQNFFRHPPVGTLEISKQIDDIKEVRRTIEEFAQKTDRVVEEDPHACEENFMVLHIFPK